MIICAAWEKINKLFLTCVAMGEVKKSRITAYVPEEIHNALKKKADAEYRTISNLAASILINYVNEYLSEDSKEEKQE